MIRVGLVGCGHIGTAHAYVLQKLTEAGLVDAALHATLDADPRRAERVAERHGGTAAKSLDDLCSRVDAVWVCTWTSGHLEVVEAAAERALPVFCEKPLAPTLAQCERVAAALETVPHQVGLVLRWAPVFTNAAEIVRSGRYGRPQATVFRDDQYFPIQGQYRSTWRKDLRSAGGGTLIEHSIHDVDILRFVLGDPTTVSARVASRYGHPGIDDVAAVTFTYPDGGTAQLTSVWHQVLSRESSRRIEIFCENALLWADDDYLGPLHVQSSDEEYAVEGVLPEWAGELRVPEVLERPVAAYAAPTKAFLDGLVADPSGAKGNPSVVEALAAHRVVDRAYRSAAAGGLPEPC